MKIQVLLVGFGMLSMSAFGGEKLICAITSDDMGDNYVMMHSKDVNLASDKKVELTGLPLKGEEATMAVLKVENFAVKLNVNGGKVEHINLQMDMNDGTRLFSNTVVSKIEKGIKVNLGLPYSAPEVRKMRADGMAKAGEKLKVNLVCIIQ